MNEAEFLNPPDKHPTPAEAQADAQSDAGEREQQREKNAIPQGLPEVSQTAREAATSEIENHGARLRTGGCGGQDHGFHVQRAMDAARGQAIDELTAVMIPQIQSSVDTAVEKERDEWGAELRRLALKYMKHQDPFGGSPVKCIGHALERLTKELAAAQSALAERTREVIGEEFMVYDEALQRNYAKLRSALAEKEKELEGERRFYNILKTQFDTINGKLFTERAAREKVEQELRHLKLDAVENAPMEHALDVAAVEMLNALRAQLQQATDETARLTAACAKEFADVERLSRKLQQSEQEPRHIEGDVKYYITYGGARFDTTGPEIVQMHMAWLSAPQLMQDISSLRATLAATQETVRRVEADRDWWKEAQEATRQGAQLLGAKRDALQKQNAELVEFRNECERQFQLKTDECIALEARNAELVKEQRGVAEVVRKALNQSPE